MKFQPQAPKKAYKIKLIEGSTNRFDGKTLSVAISGERPLSRRKFIIAMRKVVSVAKSYKLKNLVLSYKDVRALAPKEVSDKEVGIIAGTAFFMADYEHTTYKSKPKDGWNTIDAIGITALTKDAKAGFARAQIIAAEINAARELSNTPGGDMTPETLAAAAKAAAKGLDVKVDVLDMTAMEKLGMGGVVGVGKGAADKPKFIIMEYWGADKSEKPVVLVGKGVTFDTGGVQVKTGDHMYEMHMDMSGGASVIHSVILAAKLKIKTNVIGLVPAVENAVGAGAMRPGDMLKSLSGKTIEILHTDAEGRVILADALTYAKRYNPAVVADAATLTGAALTAFGEVCNAFMTNRQDDIVAFMDLAEASGDYMWPMPLWEEYDYIVKGRFGDVPNIPATGNSRYAGVIGGGKFLEVFAKELNCPWIHIDIAPKMTANAEECLAKGAAGSPVRFFLALIEKYSQQ
jgi:leucyl aminopeptidase